MSEIAINRCPRGSLLSPAGCEEYANRKGAMPADLDQSDPVLVGMLKEDLANRIWAGDCSHVEFKSVPEGMNWSVRRVRGREWLAAS